MYLSINIFKLNFTLRKIEYYSTVLHIIRFRPPLEQRHSRINNIKIIPVMFLGLLCIIFFFTINLYSIIHDNSQDRKKKIGYFFFFL